MPPDLHEDVAARLAGHDGRYTGSRRDLIQALAEARRPLTVDEIVERSPRQRLSSVYRNLAVFEAEGVVRRLAGVGDLARFELTEALVGHHHHLACQVCGAMTDVELPHELEARLDEALSQLARSEGFVLRSHELDAVGVCQACSTGPDWTRPATPPPRDR
jgi:Fe2+ or Zn2+ uptake regulation protein